MTPAEVNLVKRTWARVVPIKDTAAGLFYGKLFELDPSVKPMFKGDINEQGAKLMATLNVVVESLDSLDKLEQVVPVAQELAIRHVDYGVKPGHYDTVGTALLWTLEQGLGDGFTPDVKQAWVSAYTTLAGAMKQAAYAPA
jgi:hemoglobin-like flavoprotein